MCVIYTQCNMLQHVWCKIQYIYTERHNTKYINRNQKYFHGKTPSSSLWDENNAWPHCQNFKIWHKLYWKPIVNQWPLTLKAYLWILVEETISTLTSLFHVHMCITSNRIWVIAVGSLWLLIFIEKTKIAIATLNEYKKVKKRFWLSIIHKMITY